MDGWMEGRKEDEVTTERARAREELAGRVRFLSAILAAAERKHELLDVCRRSRNSPP